MEKIMELKVTYTHFDITKISIFDKLETELKNCLAEFGFELKDADFDFEMGERSLNFINEEWLSKFEYD
jgi:hypothetical protein